MLMYFKLAWRNLWRNKRRTLITIASVVFSIFFASMMRSMQEGSYDSMIDNMVNFYSGYLQVQDTAYWKEKSLDNPIEYDRNLEVKTQAINNVTLVTNRLESFALSAYKDKSKPVFVIGIDPQKEDKIIKLSRKIVQGKFITRDDKGVMIAEGLANYLGLKPNDTLVMISQGYHGVSATGKFAIRCIFKHPIPDFNKRLVFMSLPAAQEFYSAYNKYTSQVIMVTDHYKVDNVKNQIQSILPENKTVMSWGEMQPEMENMIEGDRAGGMIMLWVLYLVIGFGIFGTAMMMINERKHEFGVINAVGMKKYKINIMLAVETVLLGLVGTFIGLIFTAPFIYFFYDNPIPLTGEMADVMLEYGMEPYLYFSTHFPLFINQAIIVFLLCVCVSFISMFTISRMKMIKALRA